MLDFRWIPVLVVAAACASASSSSDSDGGFSFADARPVDRPDAARADAGPRADATCTQQLLVNGDFDQSQGLGASKQITPWREGHADAVPFLIAAASELPAPVTPNSGGYSASLGTTAANHALYLTFDVPADATALELRGQRWVISSEGQFIDHDFLYINLTVDGDREQLVSWDEDQTSSGWEPFSEEIPTSYVGNTVTLELQALTNDDDPTQFFLDDLEVEASLCN